MGAAGAMAKVAEEPDQLSVWVGDQGRFRGGTGDPGQGKSIQVSWGQGDGWGQGQRIQVSRGYGQTIPAIKDKLMNWSYAVQPGD